MHSKEHSSTLAKGTSMDERANKKRSVPPAPKRTSEHSKRKARATDDDPWMENAAVIEGLPMKLTCRTSDVQPTAPSMVAAAPPVVRPIPTRPTVDMDALLAKYPPKRVRLLTQEELDDWLWL